MSELLPVLQTIGVVLGAWTLVSGVAACFIIPWFRAQASANAALSRRDRRADWLMAAQPVDDRTIATR
jgi:hypothetical protein